MTPVGGQRTVNTEATASTKDDLTDTQKRWTRNVGRPLRCAGLVLYYRCWEGTKTIRNQVQQGRAWF